MNIIDLLKDLWQRIPTQLVVVAGLLLFPFGLLLLAGLVWMVEHDSLWFWFILSAICSGAAIPLVNQIQVEQLEKLEQKTSPEKRWNEQGQSAWKKVEAIALDIQNKDDYLDSWENLWDLLKLVMDTVAREFHPETDTPVMEVPVPYLLRVIELVSADLRQLVSNNIPGSHILTINDVVRGQKLASLGKEFYNIYRIVSVGIAPYSAFMREVRDFFTGKVMTSSTREFKVWLLRAYIEKIGYFSIELYSGYIVLDDRAFQQFTTEMSVRDMKSAHLRREKLEEPLRILIMGQVNSGKSSLVNALLGEMEALVDVLPQSERMTPHVLERNGLQRAIIMDTAGYGRADDPFDPMIFVKEQIHHTDLILLVCAANQSARQRDSLLMQNLREYLNTSGHEIPPPVIVVMTHVDLLRPFREWNPPYNVVSPVNQKETMIRSAMEHVAETLEIELNRVVPVCLKAERLYNVEDGIIPAILNVLDESKRSRYLRLLREYQNARYWSHIVEQSQNAGKMVLEGGKILAEKIYASIQKHKTKDD
ncbi:MAG: 50S ribosome-binding GTPase [SAR324 cluster bacterium]|nr:50S ribosome-binding GTPase [SAR324 cluster bacterium]